MPKSRSRRRPPSGRARTAGGRKVTAPRQSGPPLVPQPAPGLRGRVERISAPALLWLSDRPKLLLPVVTAVLLLGGLASPPAVGVPMLVLLLLLIGCLSYLAWPTLHGAPRLLRLATLGLLLAAMSGKVSA